MPTSSSTQEKTHQPQFSSVKLEMRNAQHSQIPNTAQRLLGVKAMPSNGTRSGIVHNWPRKVAPHRSFAFSARRVAAKP